MPTFDRFIQRPLIVGASQASSTTAIALDSAYTYNSAGDSVGMRFCAPRSVTLTDVYFHVSAINGTPGNLTVELRNLDGSNSIKPGSTQHASTTVSPGTTPAKWIKATFGSPYTLTAGVMYCVTISDPAGSGSNYATVVRNGGPLAIEEMGSILRGLSTTNGYSTSPSTATNAALVLKFGDGTLLGNPYNTFGSYTSNNYVRGLKIEGLTTDMVLVGMTYEGPPAFGSIKIFKGSQSPADTPDHTISTIPAQSLKAVLFAPYTLEKNTVYRIVIAPSGSDTNPGYYYSTDGASHSDVLACGLGGGTMYSTIQNAGGTAWVDEPEKYPQMALLLRDAVDSYPTAADVATAVWSEDPSTYTLSEAGGVLQETYNVAASYLDIPISDVPTAIWNYLLASIGTVGSIGKLVKDYLDAAISSRLAGASYTAPPAAGDIADAVWDEAAAGHNSAGTFGQKLNSAGASADPLLNDVPGAYAQGTAGHAIGELYSIDHLYPNVLSPFTIEGDLRIAQGDDYLLANGRAIEVLRDNAVWPSDLTGATVTFTAVYYTGPSEAHRVSVTGDVVTPTGSGQKVRWEWAHGGANGTDGLFPGTKLYDFEVVATLPDTSIATLRRGKMTVYRDLSL